MSAADLTKQAIVASTKELVNEKGFEKISVIEIAKRCGVNRNTFYYYFKDKYEVVEWIFKNEILPVIRPFEENKNLAESVTALCNHMKQEKPFYTKALVSNAHGSLRHLLVEYYLEYLMDFAADQYVQLGIEGKDREIIARFYSHGTIGMICDWAEGGMKRDAKAVTNMILLSAKERFYT